VEVDWAFTRSSAFSTGGLRITAVRETARHFSGKLTST
jgi:hypothetical protein